MGLLGQVPTFASMDRLGWGVLGSARIARRKVMPALMGSLRGRLVALASRTAEGARSGLDEALQEAALRGIKPAERPRTYGSYDELLADPEVEAVYIPLPNSEHLPWAIRCLQAGKHVLLEKPGLQTAAEADALAAVSAAHPDLLLAEGFMFRHHPQWALAMEWIKEGLLGELSSVHVQFSFFSAEEQNIRNKPETGGGALLDLGCYALAASRLIFQAEPLVAKARQYLGSQGVDWQSRAELHFPPKQNTSLAGPPFCHFHTDIRAAYFQRLDISGTEGRIAFERPFSPIWSDAVRPLLFGRQGELLREPEPMRADHFLLQADNFAVAIAGEKALAFGLEDCLQQARMMDLFRSSL